MAGIAKSAIAKIEAYIEKKGSKVKSNPSDISTALTEKKEKKEYFLDIPDFSTFKNGKKDGVHIEWYENGKKSIEGKFKFGVLTFKKVWKEDV